MACSHSLQIGGGSISCLPYCICVYVFTHSLVYHILYCTVQRGKATEKHTETQRHRDTGPHLPSHLPFPLPPFIYSFVTCRLYHTVIMQIASLKVTQ